MSFVSPVDPRDAYLERIARRIETLVQRDPGGRGLAYWAEMGDLLPAARSLLGGSYVAVTTGFYIPACGAIETDGPVGAIVLAHALQALGQDIVFLVDEHAIDIIEAGIASVPGLRVRVIGFSPGDTPKLRRLAGEGFSHIVAVERPGQSGNGTYRTMRGEDITSHVAVLDSLFTAPERTYTTIGIGDGGNELGLLKVSENVDRYLTATSTMMENRPISCRTPADYCIYAGVSNWGAYGLCALLAEMTGKPLLPNAQMVTDLLRELVVAGAVDGVLRKRSLSVDGLPLAEETEIVERVGAVADNEPSALPLGDAAFLWTWPEGIDRSTSERVLTAYRVMRDDEQLRHAGMVDVVPSYCAVAVHLDPVRADRPFLFRRAESLLLETDPEQVGNAGATRRLPVTYDGEDLVRVARHAGLSVRAVIKRHLLPDYTVAMIGFRPHFPYLIGLDETIATPRLESPRTRVAAGSVGIAGAQTGVYPEDSPGGWNIIGRTDPELLTPIRPGDTIIFEEV